MMTIDMVLCMGRLRRMSVILHGYGNGYGYGYGNG